MQSTEYPTTTEKEVVSDRDLIQTALRGDQSGREQLLQRYQQRLFTSMWSNVGCPVLAEDIVQDAFARAFLHLASFRNESNFYTWLYRIALNSRREYFRNTPKTISLDLFDENLQDVKSDRRVSPADAMERREDRKELRDALERLDDKYRTILILREFDGFDYRTIADVLKVRTGTVRSRLSRARAQLRRELTLDRSGATTQRDARPSAK